MTLEELIATEARALDGAQQTAAKKAAAHAAVALVQSGMRVGLGTGSTIAFFLEELAQRVRAEGLLVHGVPTSVGTQGLAERYGIALVGNDFRDLTNDLCVDGADRVDNGGNLIKGGGGALLREKMVAAASKKLCILVDATKLEPVLSDSFALPVECLRFGIDSTMHHLAAHGCTPRLREEGSTPKVTDNGNYVVDCAFSSIPDPARTQAGLLEIPGVVEVGLFVNMMSTLILGRPDGTSLVHSAP